MHSRRLSRALVEFEPAQIFLESRREVFLVWPTLKVEEYSQLIALSATPILVWPVEVFYKFWVGVFLNISLFTMRYCFLISIGQVSWSLTLQNSTGKG